MWHRAAICGAVAVAIAGCQGSRWARDDPDYAAKYSQHTDNVLKMSKQAIDARHVKEKWGSYAGVSGRIERPFAMGGEVGGFYYPTSYLELRGGLSGLIYENDTPLSGGFNAGARVQSPTRLAPFVGVSGYAGFVPDLFDTADGVDNDLNGIVDDASETNSSAVFGVAPEAGVHFWITPEWRLTSGVSYLLTTEGGDDFLLGAISLARLTGPGGPVSQRGLAQAAIDGGWKVGDGANAAEFEANSSTDEADEAPLLPPPVVQESPPADEL